MSRASRGPRYTALARLDLGYYTMPEGSRYANERIVVTGFVIRHARGVVLFDTGLSPDHHEAFEAHEPVAVRPIVEVLAAHGLSPRDLALVINCHLHSDHAGGNRHFPDVPIFVQRGELDAARAGGYTHLPSVADFPGARLEVIEGEAEVLPGLRIIPTPGHAPGHQSLVVETREGRVILAGQALNMASDYSRAVVARRLSGQGGERLPYPGWLDRFAALDPWRVLFAHDLAIWQRDAT